jgi:hypothetical protein
MEVDQSASPAVVESSDKKAATLIDFSSTTQKITFFKTFLYIFKPLLLFMDFIHAKVKYRNFLFKRYALCGRLIRGENPGSQYKKSSF